MTITGTPRGYDQKWNFKIEIDGIALSWFESMSGLEAEVGVVEQHEGGSIVVADQTPGKVKFTPVTLMVGATSNRELWDWFKLVVDAGANSGGTPDTVKKNLAVIQLERDGTEKKRWDLFQAFPSKFKAGEWDGKAEENVIQEITLTYRYFDLGEGATP